MRLVPASIAATAVFATSFTPAPIVAQSQSEIERAVRDARRLEQEFERQEREARREFLRQNIVKAEIAEHICRPMWRQNELSRREYIATWTDKKRQQRAIAEVCYKDEIVMYSFCTPEEYSGDVSSSCVGEQSDWPKPPQFEDYLEPTFRIDQFHADTAAYNRTIAKKYE